MSAVKTKSAVNGRVRSNVKLNGKTVVITGANQGIGYETALDLAGRGARVVMACRDLGRAEEAKNQILSIHSDAEIELRKLDLASLESVRECAKTINETESRLDILINNAGIMACPQWKTKDGYEMQLGVNHIGHFLFTNLLSDLLKRSSPSRIVILSSAAHKMGAKKLNWDDIMFEKKYDAGAAYAASKLANVYHGLQLSKRLQGTGVTCNVVHPGVVRTSLFDHMGKGHIPCCMRTIFCICWPCVGTCILLTPNQGAQTSIYCAIAPELEAVSGKYYDKCAVERLQEHALREDEAEKLWRMSEEWVREKN